MCAKSIRSIPSGVVASSFGSALFFSAQFVDGSSDGLGGTDAGIFVYTRCLLDAADAASKGSKGDALEGDVGHDAALAYTTTSQGDAL